VGEPCNSNDECESGQCYASNEYYQGIANPGGFSAGLSPMQSTARCHNAPPESYQAMQAAETQGTMVAGMIGLSFIPGVGPILQGVGAITNGVQAYYTCNQINEAAQNPQVTPELLDQLKTQCGLYIAGTATSLIAGGSMAAAGNKTLTIGQQLVFSMVQLTDSATNTFIADEQRQIACQLDPTSFDCTMAYAYEGLGIGGTMFGAVGTVDLGGQYSAYRNTVRVESSVDLLAIQQAQNAFEQRYVGGYIEGPDDITPYLNSGLPDGYTVVAQPGTGDYVNGSKLNTRLIV
jgi:hypothetical protein